jgi:hypothetical protein
LSTFGWAPISVSSPAAGAGVSQPLPFTIYNIVYLSANHILYNPYDRLLYASVNSAATQVTGNSIVTIDPLTGAIGKPVTVGSQPTFMSLSDDGQALYAVLSGSNAFALYRPLSHSLAFSVAPPQPPYSINFVPRGISVMPGTETTIAFDTGEDTGIGIYDIDLSSKSATLRGNLSGAYTGSGVSFLDAGDLYTFDTDTTGDSLDHFLVTATGLSGVNAFSPYESTLLGFGGFSAPPSFKLNGGLAFANAGGVANPATDPATQIGIYQPIGSTYTTGFFGTTPVEPDTSLAEVFFFGSANGGGTNPPAGFVRYDEFSFLPTGFMSLANLSTSTTQSTAVDLVRFGQDGLAFLTSAGQIYLARGPFVVPQLLQQNPKPALASVNITTATHGAGNLRITVTASNLVPGATVNWNGAPRSTTRADATHLSVAIPASDLAAAGTASITISNPATAASNATTFTIN